MGYYKHIIIILSFIGTFGIQAYTQEKVAVESLVYDTMLEGLLDRNVPEISAKGLAVDADKVILLDAREKKEFDVSHINGAIYVGYDDFNMDRLIECNKDDRIIVYCSVGYRSEKITQHLIADGFTNVANLYGGVFEWKNINQEVVDSSGASTEDVHAYDKVWGVWLNKGKKVY